MAGQPGGWVNLYSGRQCARRTPRARVPNGRWRFCHPGLVGPLAVTSIPMEESWWLTWTRRGRVPAGRARRHQEGAALARPPVPPGGVQPQRKPRWAWPRGRREPPWRVRAKKRAAQRLCRLGGDLSAQIALCKMNEVEPTVSAAVVSIDMKECAPLVPAVRYVPQVEFASITRFAAATCSANPNRFVRVSLPLSSCPRQVMWAPKHLQVASLP